MVISEIRNDMQVVKDGMEKGYCDESEMAKVEMLMSMAQNRMGTEHTRLQLWGVNPKGNQL